MSSCPLKYAHVAGEMDILVQSTRSLFQYAEDASDTWLCCVCSYLLGDTKFTSKQILYL